MPVNLEEKGLSGMTERPSEADVEAAWHRARPISGRDPALYRIAPDVIQSVIRRDCYNVRGEFGWRIECGRPVTFRKTTIESAIRALRSEHGQVTRRRAHSDVTSQFQR